MRGRAQDGKNGSDGVRGNGVSSEPAGEPADASSGGSDKRESKQPENTDMMVKGKGELRARIVNKGFKLEYAARPRERADFHTNGARPAICRLRSHSDLQ